MIDLPLNTEVVKRRLKELGLSLGAFSDRLDVDRSTVYRWLEQRRFPSADRVLHFAAHLDMDPWGLWDIQPQGFEQLLPELTRMAREGSWSRKLPAFTFAEDYLFPNPSWPPQSIAERYARHPRWRLSDFTHDPSSSRSDYYASLVLEAPANGFSNPHLWHFAYRELGSKETKSWFPYGVVRLLDGQLDLFNYIGEAETADRSVTSRALVVQTYFGKEPIEFRVASLHSFSLTIEEEAPGTLGVVGFRYPGPR